jgi:hypothetical protein
MAARDPGSLRPSAPTAAMCLALGAAASACLDPTQATVEISTNAECSYIKETGIAADDEPVDLAGFETTTDQCSGGEIGSIVLYPEGPQDGELSFKVVTSLGSTPIDECAAPKFGRACIVARRSMNFVPHHPFRVPVSMDFACAGVDCPAEQTCVEGVCTSPVVDPDDCDTPEGCALEPGPILPWGRQIGGQGSQMARHLALGDHGAVVLTGNFSDAIDFGAGALQASGASDIFVASFSPQGQVRWAQSFGGSGIDEGISVAIAPSGEVYALIVFEGEVDFGGGPIQSQGQADVVLLKITPFGSFVWAVPFASEGYDSAGKVAVDPDGNVYVTGGFAANMEVAGTTLAADSGDAFIASLSGDGQLRWVKGFGGTGYDSANAVAIGDGQVYVGGVFQDDLGLGSPPPAAVGASDAFIASFDAQGELLWTKAFGSISSDFLVELAVEGERLVAAGKLGKAAEIDGLPLPASEDDGFVIAFDPGGQALWAQLFGTDGSDDATALAIAADGSVLLGGSIFHGPAFGGPAVDVAETGAYNPFLAALDPGGKPLWIQQFKSAPMSLVTSVTGIGAAPDGHVLATGWFDLTLDLGDGGEPLVSSGAEDMFLLRIVPQ